MIGAACALDHVGIVVHDVAAARAAWASAGFAPTPAGRIMLQGSYLEFLTQNPAEPSTTLAAMLAQGEGAHVLSLRVADADAAAARLRRAGFRADLVESTRAGEAAGSGVARFRRVPLTDMLPRLQLIEHLTPDVVWHPALTGQPNGARTLAEVVIVADPPALFAARLSRVAGRSLVPADGGFLLPLEQGAVRVLSPEALRRDWPEAPVAPTLPRLVAMTMHGAVAMRHPFPGLALRVRAAGGTAPG
ncbi:MAG: VOC family protein [Rhodospirillales bacterium]|nr:VOC family protein [Rhodospirillales bacterium]